MGRTRRATAGYGRLLTTLLALAAGVGCRPEARPAEGGGGPKMATTSLEGDLAVVRQARVLFTHHSVGVNILAGIERLDAEAGGPRLRIAPLEQAASVEGPVLAHGGGGRNTDPRSKIDAFAATVRDLPGLQPDLAFMKLCYVDFDPGTNVEELFDHYRRTLEALKLEHPRIRFAHVTAPLFRRPTDLKSSARRLLGLPVWEDAANRKREEYNRRLVEHFASDPIFDLAGAESTTPGGGSSSSEQDGRRVRSLHPGYTDDGGHLNLAGQRAVGTAAVRFLAGALRTRDGAR